MPRKAKVHVYKRGSSWQVYYDGIKPRYTKDWPTEAEALRDKEQLERRIAGVGLEKGQLRSVESCLHRLANVNAPARGKSIEFAVEWFITHFKGDDTSKTLREYGDDYMKRKALKLERKTMVEITSYMEDFLGKFGHMKPAEVSIEALENYLAYSTARYWRDKCLRPFFAWLTGTTKSRVSRLLNPPLERSTFDYIERMEYRKVNPTEVLTAAEVMAVLVAAKARGVLPWFIWCIYTGMRPDAEARPFWELPEHGWNRIDLDRGIVCVTDDLEKTGTRVRDITIQPNLRAWLDWMKATGKVPVYSRRKIRDVFFKAIPKKRSQDICRHTFISFLLKLKPEHEVCFEAATSPKMIKKHYRRAVPTVEADTFWGITPKTLGV